MSMISSLIDELRQLADGQETYRDARTVMRDAADTIWQLRDDLQRANAAVQEAEHDESMAWDRVRKAEAENAKLRKFATETWELLTCNEPVFVWKGLQELARNLGIEVDE